MPSPSGDPQRDDGPNQDPLRQDITPQYSSSMLDWGRAQLIAHFKVWARSVGSNILNSNAEQRWAGKYRDPVIEHMQGALSKSSAIDPKDAAINILAVSRDEESYRVVIGLENTRKHSSICIGPSQSLIDLHPGIYAGQILQFPLDLTPGELRLALQLPRTTELTQNFFITPQGLAKEAERFAFGDLGGLVGDIFATEVRAISKAPPQAWEIACGVASDIERGDQYHLRYPFKCSSEEVGTILFEVGLEPESHQIFETFSRPVRHVVVEAPLSQTKDAPTKTPEISAREALGKLGYQPVPLLPVRQEELTPFMKDLRQMWRPWSPRHPWQLYPAACYVKERDLLKPDPKHTSFLLETYISGPDHNHILPFRVGEKVITSKEPIGVILEAKPNLASPGSKFDYSFRMLRLPPECPISQLAAHSLEAFSDSLLGSHCRIAICKAVKHRKVDWLHGQTHGYLLAPKENASVASLPTDGARVLCFTSLGGYTLFLPVQEGGLFDLNDISVEDYFPELTSF